jgi:hypothetical protein
MKAVQDVVELERISQQLNEHSRAKGRVMEALMYEKTSFHKDVNTQSRCVIISCVLCGPGIVTILFLGNLAAHLCRRNRTQSCTLKCGEETLAGRKLRWRTETSAPLTKDPTSFPIVRHPHLTRVILGKKRFHCINVSSVDYSSCFAWGSALLRK